MKEFVNQSRNIQELPFWGKRMHIILINMNYDWYELFESRAIGISWEIKKENLGHIFQIALNFNGLMLHILKKGSLLK